VFRHGVWGVGGNAGYRYAAVLGRLQIHVSASAYSSKTAR
jgi:hypothetical protein